MLELKEKIDVFKAQMNTMESGSVQYEQFRNFIQELEAELRRMTGTQVKLHIEGAPACEGCQ